MITVRPPNEGYLKSLEEIRLDLERTGIVDNVTINRGITQPDGSILYHISVQTAKEAGQ